MSGSARKMKFCPAPSPKNIENVKLTPFSTLTCIEWPKIMNKTDFWRIDYLPVLLKIVRKTKFCPADFSAKSKK